MKTAHLTVPLKAPQNMWQWLCLFTLIILGWVSREQLGMMFAEAGNDGSVLVYDADGNGVVYLSDAAASRQNPWPPRHVERDEKALWTLALALMKPSCCEAPDGLSHFWGLPKRLGAVLAGFMPGPAVEDSS